MYGVQVLCSPEYSVNIVFPAPHVSSAPLCPHCTQVPAAPMNSNMQGLAPHGR